MPMFRIVAIAVVPSAAYDLYFLDDRYMHGLQAMCVSREHPAELHSGNALMIYAFGRLVVFA